MTRVSVYSSVLTLCAAAAFATLFGCGVSKKVTPPPGITPKFVYAASCGDGPKAKSRGGQVRRTRSAATPAPTGGAIDGFSVDATTGTLTALTSSPVVTGLECPEFIGTDPDSKFLFVPDDGQDELHSYTIGTDGTLTEVAGSPYPVPCLFVATADPSGTFLIVPDFCENNIYVYSIGSTGALTAVAGSPFSDGVGNGPTGVYVDPTSSWVYVVNQNADPSTISVFALGSDGSLTAISGSPYVAGGFSYAISGTPDGKYIYVNDGNAEQILAYSADASTGALTPLSTPAFDGGGCWVSVDVTGKVLFATDCDQDVASYAIAADGALTAATGSPLTAGNFTYDIVGDPSGKFVYAGDFSSPGHIFAYTYSPAGVLTPTTGSPIASDEDILGLVVTH